MIQDYAKMALKNLRKRKVRSWLTMLGIILSIATIFVLISVSLGLQNAIEEQFRQLGTDKFFIQPKGQLGAPGTGGAVELTRNDLDLIKKISGVKGVAATTVANAKIEFKDQVRYSLAIGLDPDEMSIFEEIQSFNALDGRNLKSSDHFKINVGYDFSYSKYLEKPIKLGDTILVNDYPMKVVGIINRVGNPSDDRQIYMTEDDLRLVFDIPERVDSIVVQIDSGKDMAEVVNRVDKKLMNFRNVDEKTKDYSILTPEELLASFGTILDIITAFLAGIAAISLIVGGIGIMNTMYTSVLERTKEIGVMKAVGARNSDVLSIFLIESGILGLIGGILGVLLGYGSAKTIEYIAINQLGTTLLKAAAPFYLIFGCLAFAFVIGAVSGLWPAYRASRINVVDALRYE